MGGLDVVVVNGYYPPDTSATAVVFRDVARHLASRGHRVTVVCGRPSYDPTSRRPWRPVQAEADGPVTVLRVGSLAWHRRRLAGRIGTYTTYLAAATAYLRRRPRADVVVCGSDPPLAVVAALVGGRGAPVVYSLRDLHPDMAVTAGLAPPGPLTRGWDRLHTAALRRCAAVICLGETMADRVLAKGVDADRVHVVYDGAVPPVGAPDPTVVAELRGAAGVGEPARAAADGPLDGFGTAAAQVAQPGTTAAQAAQPGTAAADGPLVVVHAGNLGGAGPWETLVAAAGRLDGVARFVFVGDGIAADRVRAAGLPVLPFRPARELPSVMAAGDLQVVAQRRDMAGLVVPSKLFTALAHGRPVLAVVPDDSEVATIVRRARCGLVCDPDDPDAVAAAVRWAAAHPEELSAMAARAAAAGRTFDRRRLLDRFSAIVEAAASG